MGAGSLVGICALKRARDKKPGSLQNAGPEGVERTEWRAFPH